jgi:hypothetical protein
LAWIQNCIIQKSGNSLSAITTFFPKWRMGQFLKGDISKREPLKFAEEIGYV